MKKSLRLRPLCGALGYSHPRAEALISRGHITLEDEVVPGQARRLSVEDAFTLELAMALWDARITAQEIQSFGLHLEFPRIEAADVINKHFVVFRFDWKRDRPNMKANFKVIEPPRDQALLTSKTVAANDLAEACQGRLVMAMVDLEHAFDRVQEVFGKIADDA